jgi:pimeloyl-ACP methyl ester carboxylesterase
VQQFIDSLRAAPGWDDWEALPRISAPTLFITGELEDPHDTTGDGVSRMPNGRRVRLAGQGHINAFLRSDLGLPHVLEFLSANAAEDARK